MTLEDMIEKLKGESVQELVNYDVKDEWKNDITSSAEKELNDHLEDRFHFNTYTISAWEKMCCYQISKQIDSDEIDCDVALRSVVIYALAFPGTYDWSIKNQYKKKYKYCLQNDKCGFEYRGDTMNSYKTTIREYLRTYSHEEKSVKDFITLTSNNKWGTLEQYDYFYKYAHWEACILDNYNYFSSLLTHEAKEFIRLNHTMGNLIPAPWEFNCPRGNLNAKKNKDYKGKIKDYWDLTLLVIWKWYMSEHEGIRNDHFLKDIVNEIEKDQNKKIDVCKKWLECFKDWDDFVEKNYMQDFVNKCVNKCNEKNKYGMPKELWDGHFSGEVLPTKEDDFSQFFTNASAWIAARGERIALAVKNKLEDDEFVKSIISKMEKK